MKRLVCFALSLLALPSVCLAAATTVTIDSEANAYPTEDIVLDSGSRVTVTYSYRGGTKTMKEALIDKIKVNPTTDGSEPYVAFVVDGNGLANDVDFSEQPYLWLSSPVKGNSWESDKYKILVGLFEPYGDVYHFGYGGQSWNGESGILVTNLVNNPVTGAVRSLVLRGTGTTCLRLLSGGKYTFSGPISVENGADLCCKDLNGLKTASKVTFHDGTRLVVKASSQSVPATTQLEIDGVVAVRSNGGDNLPVLIVNCSVSGSGEIKLTDQGGILFAGTNNTFSGKVYSTQGATIEQRIVVGTGSAFSWGDAELKTAYPVQRVYLNSNTSTVFSAAVTGPGRFIKQGKGTLTMTSPLDRAAAVAAGLPVLEISGGGIKLGAAPTSSLAGYAPIGTGASLNLAGLTDVGPLPSGAGSLVSTPGSTLTLKGGWTNDLSFAGTLACAAKVQNTGSTRWTLMKGLCLSNELHIVEGRVGLDASLSVTNEIAVDESATLSFLPDQTPGVSTHVGLNLNIWKDVPYVFGGHEATLAADLERMQTVAPSLQIDMTEFAALSNGTTTAQAKDSPFIRIFGVSDPNYFAAKFWGYLRIAESGTYQFRALADDDIMVRLDDEEIIRLATGSVANISPVVTRELEAGDHPFEAVFAEESGWEVFMVQIKGPGFADWTDIPREMLAPTSPNISACLGRVTGSGHLRVEAGGRWPKTMDTTDFTGRVIVDDQASGDIGNLPLSSATLDWAYERDAGSGFWTAAQKTSVIMTNGEYAVELTPGVANVKGALNSSAPVSLESPWSFSFDYQNTMPRSRALGDGFFIGVHNAGTAAYDGGLFQYTDAAQRIKCDTAYGLQVYLFSSGYTRLTWVNNNNIYTAAGKSLTNTFFTATAVKDHPMHVTMAYDLTNLIISFSMDGTTLALTNAVAGTDFATKYASKSAYIGLWGSNGGNYMRTVVENIRFDTDTAEAIPALGGEVTLNGGTVKTTGPCCDEGRLAAALTVCGATTLDLASKPALAVSTPSWTFDLAEENNVLTWQGPATFDASVSIVITGKMTTTERLLADFTDFTGDLPTVALAEGTSPRLSLVWKDRKLYLEKASGVILLLR